MWVTWETGASSTFPPPSVQTVIITGLHKTSSGPEDRSPTSQRGGWACCVGEAAGAGLLRDPPVSWKKMQMCTSFLGVIQVPCLEWPFTSWHPMSKTELSRNDTEMALVTYALRTLWEVQNGNPTCSPGSDLLLVLQLIFQYLAVPSNNPVWMK